MIVSRDWRKYLGGQSDGTSHLNSDVGGGLFARAAYVAQPQEGTVTGVGSAEIKRPAEVLRVQVELVVKGKDLKEAIAKLKERTTPA